MPCALAEARPLAFRPPAGSFPSFLCHAGDLAIEHHSGRRRAANSGYVRTALDAFAGDGDIDRTNRCWAYKREHRRATRAIIQIRVGPAKIVVVAPAAAEPLFTSVCCIAISC